jgi:hypothetical protein
VLEYRQRLPLLALITLLLLVVLAVKTVTFQVAVVQVVCVQR